MTFFIFGECLAAALLLGTAACVMCAPKETRAHLVRALCFALPAALVFSRLTWCVVNYNRYILYAPEEILRLRDGGFSLWGGICAAVTALVIYARRAKLPAVKLLDAFAPGAALFITIERAAEVFTGQGIGREVTVKALENTPLSVLDPYWQDCWRFAVYRYEAVLAALVFIALVVFAVKKRRGAFICGMGTLCAFQLVFEMLRDDDYMFIYYFRISQILCAVMLLAMLIWLIAPMFREGRKKESAMLLVIFAAGMGLVVKQDFAVDNVANLEISYLIMLAAAMLALAPVLAAFKMSGAVTSHDGSCPQARMSPALIAAAFIVLASLCVFCVLLIPSGGWASSIP